MTNWTTQDRVAHEGVTRSIGEWLDMGVMQVEEHFEGRSYRYYAALGDRLFQINKAAYLSRTGQSMKRLNSVPIVDGVTITSDAIKDYNASHFPASANDNYNKAHGLTTYAQWDVMKKVDYELNYGYREHRLTLDQVRYYASQQETASNN